MVTIRPVGFDKTVQKLTGLTNTLQRTAMRNAAKNSLKQTLRVAQSEVPVQSGALKKSIKIVAARQRVKHRTAAMVLPDFRTLKRSTEKKKPGKKINLFYGAMVHDGTAERETKKNTVARVGEKFVAFGRNRGAMKPNPFLERAYSATEQQIIGGFATELSTAADKIIAKNTNK